jgi:hypothetical protein
MTRLKWWMRLVGVLYLALGLLNFLRFLTAPFEVGYGWQLFGLDLAILGAFLVAVARDPGKNMIVVYVVLVQEVIRGIGADLYAIAQGGPLGLYLTFIVIHLVIITTGIVFSRRYLPDGGAVI